MNRKRTLLLCGLAASMLALSVVGATAVWSAAPAPATMRTVFTWTAGALSDNNWSTPGNWDVGSGWPGFLSIDDDAVIPCDETTEGEPWSIQTLCTQIRHLDIEHSTNFSGSHATVGLSGVLTIESCVSDEIIVTWASGSLVTTD